MKSKWWIYGLLSLFVLVVCPQMIRAEETGSITVRSVTDDGRMLNIPNVEFELYKVGSYEDGRYRLVDELSEAEIEFDFDNSSNQNQIAQRLTKIIDSKALQGEHFVTNEEGAAVLEHRSIGVYLIVQRSEAMIEGGRYHCSPALFTLPVEINGQMLWSTTVEPKFERGEPAPIPTAEPTPSVKPTAEPSAAPRPTAKPTVKPTDKPTVKPTAKPTAKPTPRPTDTPISAIQRVVSGNVKTGDAAQVGMWALLLIISVVLMTKSVRDRLHK